jgi:hypothetical protein
VRATSSSNASSSCASFLQGALAAENTDMQPADTADSGSGSGVARAPTASASASAPLAGGGAPSLSSTCARATFLEQALAAEKAKLAQKNASAGSGAGALPALSGCPSSASSSRAADGRAARRHETAAGKRQRILSPEYCSAAFCGNRLVASDEFASGTKTLMHPRPCLHRLPAAAAGQEGLPCYHNLWAGGDGELTQHLVKQMNMSGEVRSQWVFERMRNEYYADPGPDGSVIGKPRWHYRVNGREVCMRTFAAVHGVGESTLEALQPRVREERRFAHAKHEEGSNKTKAARVDYKAVSVTAWMLAYADEIGDLMPDESAPRTRTTGGSSQSCTYVADCPSGRSGDVIIPLRKRVDEWNEYRDGRDEGECASYATFCEVINKAPELHHVKHARKCLNFQHCRVCVNLNGTAPLPS